MYNKHKIDLDSIESNLVLTIEQHKKNTLFVNDQIKNHEAKYQLKEGCTYDYSFSSKEYSLRCPSHKTIVKRHKAMPSLGTIQPNIYVGTLKLEIYTIANPSDCIEFPLEVQSVKANYREDYRYMLNNIAEICTDLILQANSPVNQSLEINPSIDNETLYQRFAFIKSMIESEEFDLGIHKIISNPSTTWKTKESLSDVRKIKRFSNQQVRSLISNSNRIPLPKMHPLQKVANSVASKVISTESYEDVDTNENRFIKHALNSYKQFCEDIQNHKNAKYQLKQESKPVIEKLENLLQSNFFKSISTPQTLNLNSPLLQRKSGYREQLKLWLQFDLAAKLVWQGGDDVYKAGKKDIATLYEYWLFFKLLKVIEEVFSVSGLNIEELIKPSEGGLSLQLKQGKFTAINGVYNKGNRNLNIRFNYNKSFKGYSEEGQRQKEGSWTTRMRPDYTLSIWPEQLSDEQAESLEQIVHIHFDAKYKIANLNAFLDSDLDSEKEENKKGYYKNADLLKMHAYKDAIRRTSGAYVLYPGTEDKTLVGFHEILPGLGAFSIPPKHGSNPTRNLEIFLQEILDHFLNRSSQRENISSKTYDITKDGKGDVLNESIPEYIGDNKLIPNETSVLVGYCNSSDQYEWIKKTKLYNFRTGSGNGSLVLDKETVDAKYLLLHRKGDNDSCDFWKIISKGPKVYSRHNLESKGYPKAKDEKTYRRYYLVIEIENITDIEFKNKRYKFKELTNYKTKSESAYPFTSSLTELMRSIVND